MSCNKAAIVTGAGQGIGKAIAMALAQKGAAVMAADLNGETAKAVCEEIKKNGGAADFMKTDVSCVASLSEMVEKTAKTFGGVDILVNNAGIMHTTPIPNITEDEWDKIMNVNLKSVFFALQKVLPFMQKRGGGKIINISSLAGRMGGIENGVGYSASKAGIIGLTRAFATRLAKDNINVNCVAPGTTESEIIKQIPPENIERLKNQIPLHRLGTPEKIAAAVAFLASDEADFITGAVLDVNGGIYMG